jgi:hypothetical protein
MNDDHIKALADCAHQESVTLYYKRMETEHPSQVIFYDIFNKKFAELIIQECVQTLRDNTPVLDENESVEDWNRGYIRAMLDCEHHITEHFGIER